MGVWLSTRPGSRADRIVSYVAAITNGLPAWWAGILLILVFSFWLRILPSGGMYSTPPPEGAIASVLDLAWHALLPILTLVLVSIGPSIYVIRTMTLNVALQDHVTVARAKGLPEGLIRRRHILRVAAPPIVTGLILGLAATLGGSILIETVFAWEGMGQLYFKTFTRPARRVDHHRPDLHVHAHLRGRPPGAGDPLRLPRPPGALPVRRRATCCARSCASTPGKLGVHLAIILGLRLAAGAGDLPARLRAHALVQPGGLGRLPQGRAAGLDRCAASSTPAPSTGSSRPSEPTESTERGAARVDDLRPRPSTTARTSHPSFLSFSLGEVTTRSGHRR